MKDAKGHGSDARGAHSQGVNMVGNIPLSPKAVAVIRAQATTGFSVKPDGSVPTTGFQVALRGRTERNPLDLDNIAQSLRDHIKRNQDVYQNPAMYVGGWNSPYTGKVHLEPSENIPDKTLAIKLGKERNQVSAWDNAKGEDVPIGGTGIEGIRVKPGVKFPGG